ncbi:hypothetical protein CEP52_002130 [Fusarium oligoseptatum]|uniref:AB hydrolase-1 domain-containing protein n=1 Tax=Fusarium oligoseptatum TaxID=2604345 RepID=A0A428UFN7_9HYPO|nr:hypothetical protein CEP52_002130 [Fusarium oligoseptatum]
MFKIHISQLLSPEPQHEHPPSTHTKSQHYAMSTINTQVQLSDGAKLHVWLLGSENKTKPLVIVLHGAPGLSSHTSTESAYKFLAEKFRVLVYDARGSGVSDVKGPFTDERWIADVDELRAWVGVETFILAGYSYGGFLALNYALTFPHRLAGLILQNAWACGPLGTHRVLASLLTSNRIKPDPARQARLWSGNVRDKEDAEKGLAEIITIYTPEKDEQSSEPPSFDSFETFSFSQPRFDVRGRLGEIKTPTLVVVGSHDIVCPLEEAEDISRGIPNNELVVFDHSGHNPAADEPEKFQKVVYGFLEKLRY